MADGTKIEWTSATWNVVNGCSVVSPGCTNCYAMRLAGTRMRSHPTRQGLTMPSKAGPVWTGEVRFVEQLLDQPLRWAKPRMIFVCAHGDLFHEAVPDEWIDRVFAVMALAPQHTFQCLTKRPARMRAYLASKARVGDGDLCRAINRIPAHIGARPGILVLPLPNVWLGTSVEDQRRADERVPILLDTPAAVRWISAEPLLGPVDLARYLGDISLHCLHGHDNLGLLEHEISYVQPPAASEVTALCPTCGAPAKAGRCSKLDWVVAGGESGPGARPFVLGWGKDLIRQCREAAVPVFMKQVGAIPTNREGERCPHIHDPKGGDPAEWPEDLRVREWPR